MPTKSDKINYITDKVSGKDVLDIGCYGATEDIGDDHWLHGQIVESAKSCVGLDINEHGVQVLSEAGYNVRHGDAQNFHFDEKFDVIVAGEMVEKLPNPGGFFESARSHLRDGGKLIISTYNPFALVHIVHHIIPFSQPKMGHNWLFWFGPQTLNNFGSKYGFQIQDIHYAKSDSFGITQLLYELGMPRFEDEFIAVYKYSEN